MRRGLVTFAIVVGTIALVIVGVGWWIFSPSHAFYILDTPTGVQLISDTSAVWRLITIEERDGPEEVRIGEALLIKYGPLAIVERRRHADQYFPQHVKFLDEMAHQPSVKAPNGSYVRLLVRTNAKCEADPTLSAEYAKVRITSGSLRGSEGWLCYWRDIAPTIESSIPRFSVPHSQDERPTLTAATAYDKAGTIH